MPKWVRRAFWQNRRPDIHGAARAAVALRTDVHIVVDVHDRLLLGDAHDSTDVLNDAPTVGNREGEKERVELVGRRS